MSNKKDKLKQLINSVDNGTLTWDEFKTKVDLEIFDVFTNELQLNNQSIEAKDYTNIKPMVEIKELTKHYKGRAYPAINKISFNIYPGEFHAFIGANGAGKTTAIKSIIGAYSDKRLSGKILINGIDNKEIEAKKLIGYIPEEAKFPKTMKLKDYLYLMSRLSGIESQEAKKRVSEILKDLKLESVKNKRPYDFSSGQKKRVLLAQALVHNPQILIMDEPAANLDPMARIGLFDELIRLKNQGKSIFISSHILDEVGKYATYCTIIDGGNVVFNGQLDKTKDLSTLYRNYVKKGSVDTGVVNSN